MHMYALMNNSQSCRFQPHESLLRIEQLFLILSLFLFARQAIVKFNEITPDITEYRSKNLSLDKEQST